MMAKLSTESRINKNIPVPLYYQLKELLREVIRNSAVGDPIPTESELCEQFDVSRPTVRQAISELVAEGYLRRSKGKGTFVTEPKVRRDFLLAFESFNTEMSERGIEPKTQVLTFSITKANEIASRKLMISQGSNVIFVRRLRLAYDRPLMVVNSYLPYDRLPGFEKFDLTTKSLHSAVRKGYGFEFSRAVRSIEAVGCGEEEAPHLQIDVGAPVQYLETIVYVTGDWPVSFSTAWYRGDRSRFTVSLSQDEFQNG